MNEFVISFSGLKNGLHSYEFEINKEFFEHFEYSEISRCDIKVDVDLDKQERMMVFTFQIKGKASVQCDRCSGLYDQDLSSEERLIVKTGGEEEEETEEIVNILEKDYQFNLAPFIYEFVILAFPAKRAHPENKKGKSQCDPEVLKILKNNIVEESHDPRWDALKKLKTDNK
ncbi:DUF177 domain-containing protein [Bacteroidota bacterium]